MCRTARKVRFKVAGCISSWCKIQNTSGMSPWSPSASKEMKTQSLTKKRPYNISLEKTLYVYMYVYVCIFIYTVVKKKNDSLWLYIYIYIKSNQKFIL